MPFATASVSVVATPGTCWVSRESVVFYTVQYSEANFAFGQMSPSVWDVWSAAGWPQDVLSVPGIVWEGDPEYGTYALA